MNLYLDAGNSRFKWQLADSGEIGAAVDLDALAIQWRELDTAVERVIACSVRSRQTMAGLEKLAKTYFGAAIAWQISSSHACGVVNAYTEPRRLGADRWMALLAAHARYPHSACVVVDAGTAVTVDLVAADGRHCGGVILPGFRTMLASLDRADQLAARGLLDSHDPAALPSPLAATTEDAMLAGVVYAVNGGIQAVISEQIKRIEAKISAIPVVLTGGDYPMLKLTSLQTICVPALVLEGLRLSARCAR